VYGRTLPSILLYTRGSTTIAALDESLLDRDELLRVLKANLLTAQHKMVQQANAHRHDLQFVVGDLVLVRLKPHRQILVRQQRQHKLSKKFDGPFEILECIGKVAYRLQLPSRVISIRFFMFQTLNHFADLHYLSLMFYLPIASLTNLLRSLFVQFQAAFPSFHKVVFGGGGGE